MSVILFVTDKGVSLKSLLKFTLAPFFISSSIISFELTEEEVPHSTYVEIEEIDDQKDILKIQAYVYCETDSQRYILI